MEIVFLEPNFPEGYSPRLWVLRKNKFRELKVVTSWSLPKVCFIAVDRECRVEVRIQADIMEGEKKAKSQCFRCATEGANSPEFKCYHGIFVRGLLLFPLPGTEGTWGLWNGFTLTPVSQLGSMTKLVQKEASQEPLCQVITKGVQSCSLALHLPSHTTEKGRNKMGLI